VLSVTKAMRHRALKSTKTGETRRFAIEAALLPLLRAMREEAGHKCPVLQLREDHMARLVRRWLHIAGVRRPEPHQRSPTRKPLTWHDLRATGATWMAVRGDDPLKIKQRCGHATFSTTELYIREAEAVRDRFGVVFPPLPEALVSGRESSQESSGSGGAGPKPGFSSLRGKDLNPCKRLFLTRRCRSRFHRRGSIPHRNRGISESPPVTPASWNRPESWRDFGEGASLARLFAEPALEGLDLKFQREQDAGRPLVWLSSIT
jgi:hypothetical protein